MKTIDISHAEIKRKFDENELKQAEIENKPSGLSKAVKAAYRRAKKVSAVRDAQCAEHVAEYAHKRETDARMRRIGSIVSTPPKSDGQSTLFDF